MVTTSFRPGEPAPRAGWYCLFEHHGPPTPYAVWREVGDPLPLAAVNGHGRLHYRLVADETVDAG
jgi:hypothetical protein